MDLQQTTAIMGYVVAQGGLGRGGLNFDAKVRRESLDPVDLVVAHVGAMDCYALGLRKAADIYERGELRRMLDARYLSWTNTDIGRRVEAGEATLEECASYARTREAEVRNKEKNGGGDGEGKEFPVLESARQELFEIVRNRHLYG